MRVLLRYLSEEVDRHSNRRIYFRHSGRRIRIREPLDTPEFHARYHDLLDQARTNTWAKLVTAPATGATAGTFGWLALRYMASAAFRDLDPSTQAERRPKLGAMMREPVRLGVDKLFRDMPLERITPAALAVLRDRKRSTPHAANDRVKILRSLFKWSTPAHTPTNPAAALVKMPAKSDGHHTWTEAEIDQYEAAHPIGSKARLAMSLLLYTGCRRSDVVRLGRPHVIEGRLRWTAAKNRRRSPVVVDIPILEPLRCVLDASPLGAICFLETEHGRPFSKKGFGARLQKWCADAGLSGCSAHGLRKAGSTRAAEAGATAHQLMAMFGWKTLAEAERYTRAAERKGMATAGMATMLRARTR